MLKKKSEIELKTLNDEIIVIDDVIGTDFIMDYLDVSKSTAYRICAEINKEFGLSTLPTMRAKTILSAFYKKFGIKGNFGEKEV